MTLLIVSLFLPCTIAESEKVISSQSMQLGNLNSLKRRNTSRQFVDLDLLSLKANSHGNIGLQNAISSIPASALPRKWIGSIGSSLSKLSKDQLEEILKKFASLDQFAVLLSDEEMDGHYNQFCKGVKSFLFKSSYYGKLFTISYSQIQIGWINLLGNNMLKLIRNLLIKL